MLKEITVNLVKILLKKFLKFEGNCIYLNHAIFDFPQILRISSILIATLLLSSKIFEELKFRMPFYLRMLYKAM